MGTISQKDSLPLVTIGVCVRNCASTIREAIESIMAQDYPHELMEIVFVDDGSKDNTLSIIKGYASKMDMKVKIFHHEWRGLGPSRNVVVKNASGKYILWVDGDMLLSKDFVKRLVRFIEKNPRVAIAKGMQGMFHVKSLAAVIENILFIAYDSEEKDGFIRRLPGTGGSIYRKEAIENVGGFDSNIKGACEDIDMAYRIILNGWLIKKVEAIFYEIHRHSWKNLWDEYYWMGEGMCDVIREHPRIIDLYKMLPLGGFIAGVIYSVKAYRIIKKKIVFLLPFHFTFKLTAWCLGFASKSLKFRFKP